MAEIDNIDALLKHTLILVDDHGIVREGIAAFCESRPNLEVIAQCSDGEGAVELILSLKPDFAILDLQMPTLSGLDVICRVREAGSKTRLIVLSVNREESLIRDVFRCGADAYLLKDGPARHLFDAINFVLDGGQYLTPLVRREALDAPREDEDP